MIVSTQARMIVREHLHRPLGPRVLELGPQEIRMSTKEVISLIEQEGYSIYPSRKRLVMKLSSITDERFFSLLGISSIEAMDINSNGGANLIHDLNKPVPESLHGQFDFIVDGGTFDHILDVRVAFENVVRMLKPNGRILHWNAASNCVGRSYTCLAPDLFLDYYLVNRFADCQVYIVEGHAPAQQSDWAVYKPEGIHLSTFDNPEFLMTIVLAEKGLESTFGAMPVQEQYRNSTLWKQYESTYRKFAESGRKPWIGSMGILGREIPGFKYMGLI